MASQDKPSEHRQPTNSELFSSAKYVAEAARASFNKGGDKVDKAKLAGASGDLLGAASHYGKLEEKGLDQYVEKAESYLHQYGGSDHAKPESKQEAPATAQPSSQSDAPAAAEEKKSEGGGFGSAFKMAEGFLK